MARNVISIKILPTEHMDLMRRDHIGGGWESFVLSIIHILTLGKSEEKGD